MRLPPVLIGVAAAVVSFTAVGIPLYNRGMSFLPCFTIQLGVMALLILLWMKIQERLDKRRKER